MIPEHPSFLSAMAYWFKLGCISFGGPAGQISLMHAELVERRRWISEQRFLHALNYCMALPGPEAQQLATYLGWLLHGVKGGLTAGILFVLPAFLLLTGLSWAYALHADQPLTMAALYGIKPVVTAIVILAAWRLGRRTLKTPALGLVAALAFLVMEFLGAPFPLVIAGAALAGILLERLRPGFAQPASSSQTSQPPALIDDQNPPPVQASLLASLKPLILTLGVGALLLMLTNSYFSTMALFFTQTALVTFGGAYAVLPYVQQAAVSTHGWLSAPQMIDGLALGETTPGPLIIIVAFVGFMGGWNGAAHLGLEPALAGCIGAGVATLFTFLPSFAFIFAGAPWIEASRDNLRLQAPLTAISAAVVGVILTLALLLARHVFIGAGGPDLPALGLCLGALLAMGRWDLGVISTIGIGAVLGIFWKFLI